MTISPTLTPAEADHLLRTESDPLTVDGFTYRLDGPQMCPKEVMAPTVSHPSTETQWFVTGEDGDPITEISQWVAVS